MMIVKIHLLLKNNSRLFVTGIIILISILAMSSCQNREIYYHFKEIKGGEWSKNDTLHFEIDSSLINPGEIYNITVELGYSANYPYQNLWLYSIDNLTDSHSTLYSHQYLLADSFGRWYGSGFGALYQLTLPYKEAVSFKERRSLHIKIIHGMRDEPLVGIEKLGVKVEKEK